MAICKKLFKSGTIGSVEVKNRLVMAPMGTHANDAEGFTTDNLIQYYAARARGGVGLVIVQSSTPVYEGIPYGMTISDDKYIPGLKRLADAIHLAGAMTIIQLNHHGKVLSEIRKGCPHPEMVDLIGPSAIPWFANNVAPREMSAQDISTFIRTFVEAAIRAKTSGFDGVEIHAAHGYLLHSFLSPLTNRRNDRYGGSRENRARIVSEMLSAIRKTCGVDFAIVVRISGTELLPGGIQIEDAVAQAPMFVEAGADAIHVSACGDDYPVWQIPSYLEPDGAMVDLAAAIKKAVRVPVIAVGKIGDPILAEKVLKEGKADFVAMGRPLLADPELPNKAREGRLEDINRCIFCNNCFMSMFTVGWKGISNLACTVNPNLLAESENIQVRAASHKKVMVIGGGLAGMMAARDLALLGHHVTLHEKNGKLGGQWNIVCSQEHKAGFARFSDNLQRSLTKAGVKAFLNSEVTLAFVKESKPDAIVVATGASPAKLNVPGVDGKNVVQAVDVILGRALVGKNAVVISGCYRTACRGAACHAGPSGCQVGMEVALSLAKQGKKVTLTTRSELGRGLEKCIYLRLRNELIDNNVRIFVNSTLYEIRDGGVYIAHQSRLLYLPADTIILAIGYQSENRLAQELKGTAAEVHMIGDCIEPRTALHATQEASRVAKAI